MKSFAVISRAGWHSIARLGMALFVALLVGLALGRVALVFALVLAVYAGLQLWQLLRFEYWLRFRRIRTAPDASGLWGEVVAIVSRIYRRKQFHRARVTTLLREFRRLTTAMPEGAVLLGPEHEILWFNGRAGDWLNLRRKRDFGMRIENLVRHPDFVAYLRGDATDQGVVIQEPGQNERWLSFHVVRTGTAERQLLIVRDVTREQRLQSMRKDFIANASHELRSPLTVVSGYLDTLSDDLTLDEAWRAPIGEMRRQAERMSAIIDDLLELSKLEAGERVQDEEAVDIGGLLAMLRKEALANEQQKRHVTVRLDSDALLLGVESELHSIVSNLMSNALKYTSEGGRIDLRWWVDEEGGHVCVTDDGIGIASEHIPRLTERFYRVDPGRARSMGGSGLGLAIVKHALQRHDGTLQIESREGAGSTFTCHFPPQRIVAREALQNNQTANAL